MALSVVGTPQAGATGNGNNVVLTYSTSPIEDDMEILVGCQGNNKASDPSGFTAIATHDADSVGGGVYRRFFGASPPSSVTYPGSGSGQDGTAAASIILRGVDATTPLDVSVVSTGIQIDATSRDLDSITPVTDACEIVLAYIGRGDDGDVPTGAPTNYTGPYAAGVSDTNRALACLAHRNLATAAAEDPGAFTESGGPTFTYIGWTLAIRPSGLTLTILRPTSDIVGGGWDTQPTTGQDLYAQVDEAVRSDTDYIEQV